MKKRPIFRGVCLVMVFLLLSVALVTATGQGEETSAGGAYVLRFWTPAAGGAQQGYWQSAKTEFESLNPNAQIELTFLPSPSDDQTPLLNNAVLSGEYPDIFCAYLYFMGQRGSKGEFAPLKSYMDPWDQKSDLNQVSLEWGAFKGVVYGVGFWPQPELFCYRKDIFEQAGIKEPPTTWDEVRAYAGKLVERDSDNNVTRAGYALPTAGPSVLTFQTMCRANGSLFVDEVNLEPAFTDKAAIDTLQFLVDFYNDNITIPYNENKRGDGPFVQGNAAMGIIGINHIANWASKDPGMRDRVAFAQPIQGKVKPLSFCANRFLTIGETSKVKDQAWQMVDFLMSSEQMWARAEQIKVPPVRASLRDQYLESDPELNSVVFDTIVHGTHMPVTPWTDLMKKYTGAAYEEALYGRKSAEQALMDAESYLLSDIEKLVK